MIEYVRQRYPVDPGRITVGGFSSGAMMTNVMLGLYPDVFTDSPQASATQTRYSTTGGTAPVEAISFQGYGHSIPFDGAQAVRFLGLDTTSPGSSGPTSPRPLTPVCTAVT